MVTTEPLTMEPHPANKPAPLTLCPTCVETILLSLEANSSGHRANKHFIKTQTILNTQLNSLSPSKIQSKQNWWTTKMGTKPTKSEVYNGQEFSDSKVEVGLIKINSESLNWSHSYRMESRIEIY